MEEILDIINDLDEVTGSGPRSEVKKKRLNYRIVDALIVGSDGRLLLQQRAKHKYAGGLWGQSVGGHVLSGESYEQAIRREIKEETGIKEKVILNFITVLDLETRRSLFEPYFKPEEIFPERPSLFWLKHDGPFSFDEKEVGALKWYSIPEVEEIMNSGEASGFFHPYFRSLWQIYREAVSLRE